MASRRPTRPSPEEKDCMKARKTRAITEGKEKGRDSVFPREKRDWSFGKAGNSSQSPAGGTG